MKRVLFVEDDLNMLESLSRMLRAQRCDWQMAFANHASQAIAMLRSDPYDIVVSDIHMPGMNGSTLLRLVRESFPNVLRIVLSGYFEREATLRAAGLAHHYISKPCTVEKLRGPIECLLRAASVLTDESTRRVVGSIGTLPPLRQGAVNLLAMFENPGVNVEQVRSLIDQDDAMRAGVRELVRTPQSDPSPKEMLIDSAIRQAGLVAVLEHVTWAEIFRAFQPEIREPHTFDALRRHCQRAARIARMLPASESIRAAGVIAALLHDIGKLVLALRLPDQFNGALQKSLEQNRPLYEAEEELMGTSHAEIGAYVLSLWGISRPIVDAIARHHHPPAEVRYNEVLDLVVMTHLADSLERDQKLSRHGSVLGIESAGSEIDPGDIRCWGLTVGD